MSINEKFEKAYVKHAPSWTLERDPDGRYKYHATQSAFLLFEEQEREIEELAQFKDLYKRAIISAKKPKNQLNSSHVESLGVGSLRALELCELLNIDPNGTNMHIVANTKRQTLTGVGPIEATDDQPVDLVFHSPDCKHLSEDRYSKSIDKKMATKGETDV